ncbi:hypothetical protein O181_004717 [Austropuccinia psidii MF-1]|uniref:Uncharacterized protein n=1 Tax=Austropuccinia psidii MF-1 TaxID=1389203 RepID=A0A9Q3BHD3_9BASI|nr:hypothetical protein [Austropuccinia psidii MF-1]
MSSFNLSIDVYENRREIIGILHNCHYYDLDCINALKILDYSFTATMVPTFAVPSSKSSFACPNTKNSSQTSNFLYSSSYMSKNFDSKPSTIMNVNSSFDRLYIVVETSSTSSLVLFTLLYVFGW